MSDRKQLKITILELQAKKLQLQMDKKIGEIEEISCKYDKIVEIIRELKGVKPQYCNKKIPDMDASVIILDKMRKARDRENEGIFDGNDDSLNERHETSDLDNKVDNSSAMRTFVQF